MNFYQFTSTLHGYMAVLACVLIVIITIMAAIYFFNKKEIPAIFRKLSLYTLITFHTQLLLGVIMLFLNSGLMKSFDQPYIQGKVSLMEHVPTNFTVVLLVTVFYSILKKKQHVNLVMLLLLIIDILLLGRTFMLLSGVLQSQN